MIMNSKIFIGIGANLRFNQSLTIKENCLNVINSLNILLLQTLMLDQHFLQLQFL